MDPQELKAVRIKTGVLKRSQKDFAYYQAEIEKEIERLNKMKGDETIGPFKMNQQEKVIEEAKSMVPVSKTKMEAALQELKELCAPHENDDEAKEVKEIKEAFAQIEKAENFIENL